MVEPRKNLANKKLTLKELFPGSRLLMPETGWHPGFPGAIRPTLPVPVLGLVGGKWEEYQVEGRFYHDCLYRTNSTDKNT